MNLFTTFLAGILLSHASPVEVNPSTSVFLDSAIEGAGFTEAAFDKTTIEDILDDRDCIGVRLYNVMTAPTGGNPTVMAIGFGVDGSELNGTFLSKKYRRNDGMSGQQILITNLSKNKAGEACQNLVDAGHTSYCSDFTKSEIENLLGMQGCLALKVTPASTGGNLTMTITAATITQTGVVPLGEEPQYQVTDTEPCPVVCGDMENYVN